MEVVNTMGGSQMLADLVIQFAKVVSSSLATPATGGAARAVQYAIAGIGDAEGLEGGEGIILTDDNAGERTEDGDVFGQIGIIARPLPPTTSGALSEHAEVVCVRTADGLVPVATRDVRLRMFGNAPNEGAVALVGYGGSYHAIAPVDNDDLTKGAIHTIYCPYDFNSSGVAQKAHTITIDPTSGNESISIVHAEGTAITMSANKEILLKNSTGSSYIMLDDGGITMTGQINLSGSVVIGNPAAAVPLLAGAASPPCSTLFVSP